MADEEPLPEPENVPAEEPATEVNDEVPPRLSLTPVEEPVRYPAVSKLDRPDRPDLAE